MTEQLKNIYWQGKIYENVEQGGSRYNYPAIEVIPPHSFTDGQEVVEGKDYEKKCQHKGIHNSTCIYLATALPLAQPVQPEDDGLTGHEDELKVFKQAAFPLIKYLCENCHPHCSVIVTSTGAELVEGIKHTGEVVDFLID